MHATAVARGAVCVLLRGPSGSGKSDLALRLMALGPSSGLPIFARESVGRGDDAPCFRLVSDDQVLLRRTGDGLEASAPATIAGKMEVRGLGIIDVPAAAPARAVLAVELVNFGAVPRMPDHQSAEILGVVLPLLRLAAFEHSAPIKVALALAAAASSIGA